jgi:RNA polymerase sigma-70 factor (ECF subfamily)
MTTIRLFKSKAIRNAASGAEADWNAVYNEQLPRIYNFFLYQVNDEAVAEDLTSATFQRAWQNRHYYRKDLSRFTTWLFGIARHIAADHFRKSGRTFPLASASELIDESTPDEAFQRMQDVQRLAVLLAQLSQREQELIALKYGGGLTNRAIAQITGLSESNVGTMLHRIVCRLREQWEQ